MGIFTPALRPFGLVNVLFAAARWPFFFVVGCDSEAL
jgi:hypothetical protein